MYIYILAGSDGWHKVGVSWNIPQRRDHVSWDEPHRRPITVARQYWVGPSAYVIEHAIHKALARFERQGEWFDASLRRCSREVCFQLRRNGIAPRWEPKQQKMIGLRQYHAERDAEDLYREGILWRRVGWMP